MSKKAKACEVTSDGVHHGWLIWCPGCKRVHRLLGWEFNGDIHSPTFRPSLLCKREMGPDYVMEICHSYITDGKIRFLNDSTHELAGKTVDIPEEFE